MVKKSRKKPGPDLMSAAAQIAGSVAGAPAGTLGAAGASTLAKLGVEHIRARAADAVNRRESLLALELERLLAENPDMGAVVIPGDEEQSEIFFRLYRSMMDAVGDWAIPPLVRLTGEYLGKPRDSFFTCTAKLLEQMGKADLATLGTILDACMRAPEGTEVVVAAVVGEGRNARRSRMEVSWWTGEPPKTEEHQLTRPPEVDENAVSIVLALKRNGLATECPAGMVGSSSGPGRMVVGLAEARRLRRIVGRQS